MYSVIARLEAIDDHFRGLDLRIQPVVLIAGATIGVEGSYETCFISLNAGTGKMVIRPFKSLDALDPSSEGRPDHQRDRSDMASKTLSVKTLRLLTGSPHTTDINGNHYIEISLDNQTVVLTKTKWTQPGTWDAMWKALKNISDENALPPPRSDLPRGLTSIRV